NVAGVGDLLNRRTQVGVVASVADDGLRRSGTTSDPSLRLSLSNLRYGGGGCHQHHCQQSHHQHQLLHPLASFYLVPLPCVPVLLIRSTRDLGGPLTRKKGPPVASLTSQLLLPARWSACSYS